MLTPAYGELLQSFATADSVEGIHDTCAHLCEIFEFDFFLYGQRVPTSFVAPQIFIISGFPETWWQRYKEANHIEIDPTLAHCQQSLLPVSWSDLAARPDVSARERHFMMEAREHGLGCGITFPVHGAHGEKALLSLGRYRCPAAGDSGVDPLVPHLQLLAHHLHEAVRRTIEIEEIATDRPRLSARERECLLWAAEGKTAWETGQILGITERTAIFHLHNAAGKLNVSNRQHAVARAISLGLIVPQLN